MMNLAYYAFEIIKGSVLVLALAVTYIHARKLQAHKKNRTAIIRRDDFILHILIESL